MTTARSREDPLAADHVAWNNRHARRQWWLNKDDARLFDAPYSECWLLELRRPMGAGTFMLCAFLQSSTVDKLSTPGRRHLLAHTWRSLRSQMRREQEQHRGMRHIFT